MFAAVMHGFWMHRIIRLRSVACSVRDIAGAWAVAIRSTRGVFDRAEAKLNTLKDRCTKETYGKHQVPQFAEKRQRSLLCKQRHCAKW